MTKENIGNVFERVTQKIIEDLEKGVRTWQKPWDGDSGAMKVMRPLRHTGEPYNGVNILLLWSATVDKGFSSPTWMTFKQAQEYGANVRKGEKASYVVYANKIEKTEKDEVSGEESVRQIPFMRGYSVFNVEQIEGLPDNFKRPSAPHAGLTKNERLANVDQFIRNTGAVLRHGGDAAYYQPGADYIRMPDIDAFPDAETYYSTLAHETTHWTAHKSRLDRHFGQVKPFDAGYAMEELVAEIGSAFLCADLGISPDVRADHAEYIDHWLKALKNDKRLIFSAASHATKAVDFLKKMQPPLSPEMQPEKVLSESSLVPA